MNIADLCDGMVVFSYRYAQKIRERLREAVRVTAVELPDQQRLACAVAKEQRDLVVCYQRPAGERLVLRPADMVERRQRTDQARSLSHFVAPIVG